MLNDTILINKPINWTSFDVVKKVRLTLKKHFQIKKIKYNNKLFPNIIFDTL